MKEPIKIADSGLQPERTVIAWNRTMVSFLLTSAVLLRWLPYYGLGIIVLVAICASLAVGILGSQRARYRKMTKGLQAERISADVIAVLLTTLSLICLGICAIVLVLGR